MEEEMAQIKEDYHKASTIAGDIAYRITCFQAELQTKFNEMIALNKKADEILKAKEPIQELAVVAPTEGN